MLNSELEPLLEASEQLISLPSNLNGYVIKQIKEYLNEINMYIIDIDSELDLKIIFRVLEESRVIYSQKLEEWKSIRTIKPEIRVNCTKDDHHFSFGKGITGRIEKLISSFQYQREFDIKYKLLSIKEEDLFLNGQYTAI